MIFAALLGLTFVACGPQAEVAPADGEAVPEKAKTAKELEATKAQKDSVAYLVGVNFGSFIKGNNFGEDLSYAMIKKGIDDFLAAKGNMRDPEFATQFKIDLNEMNDIFNRYLQQRYEYTKAANKEKGDKFLAANKKKPNVQVTESGLQYIVEEAGSELKPVSLQDTVLVRYKGTLIDGTVFDETAEDAEPVRFALNNVIKGWGEGLQLVGEGGKIKLFLPSDIAYGENGSYGIEPNSALIFDVDLIQVIPFVPKEEVAE